MKLYEASANNYLKGAEFKDRKKLNNGFGCINKVIEWDNGEYRMDCPKQGCGYCRNLEMSEIAKRVKRK